jgi:hypothetical protein
MRGWEVGADGEDKTNESQQRQYVMARSRFNDPIEPMTLQNMRGNGVRSLAVQCHECRHERIMNVDHLPADLTVPSFGPRMVCTRNDRRGRSAELEGTRNMAQAAHCKTARQAMMNFGEFGTLNLLRSFGRAPAARQGQT